ncbi:MAG: helix-turn-helix domain-containing protein [Saprospiraceae bacterium]|nr:helix-turn-helix domain-containing protein [Saprospiraceae bacterium]
MRNQPRRKFAISKGVQKIALLLIFLLPAFGHLQSQSAVSRKPIISHIDIMEHPVNFSRLNDEDYRETLPFANELLQSFDSLEQFSDCPNRLELPHDLNTIKLYFSLPNWKASHNVFYSHLVQGNDPNWSPPAKDPFISLTNLSPGAYTVQIKARAGSGNWTGITSYSINIQRPWWQTWWALTLLSFAILSAIVYLIQYWLERQQEIREMYQLLEAYKKAALSPFKVRNPADVSDGFIRLVNHTLETHLSDENFGIAELCELLNISRAQLHRKLKQMTGLSTSHYIRSLRLQIAKEMFQDPNLNVSEVAFAVGFSNAAYFSRVFKSQYGISPSEARDYIQGNND